MMADLQCFATASSMAKSIFSQKCCAIILASVLNKVIKFHSLPLHREGVRKLRKVLTEVKQWKISVKSKRSSVRKPK